MSESYYVLKIQYIDQPVETRTIRARQVMIGRDAGDIALKDPQVSSRHAEILFVNGRVTIKDLGSTNGILIDGVRTPQFAATPGQTFICGQTPITVMAIQGEQQAFGGGKTMIAMVAPPVGGGVRPPMVAPGGSPRPMANAAASVSSGVAQLGQASRPASVKFNPAPAVAAVAPAASSSGAAQGSPAAPAFVPATPSEPTHSLSAEAVPPQSHGAIAQSAAPISPPPPPASAVPVQPQNIPIDSHPMPAQPGFASPSAPLVEHAPAPVQAAHAGPSMAPVVSSPPFVPPSDPQISSQPQANAMGAAVSLHQAYAPPAVAMEPYAVAGGLHVIRAEFRSDGSEETFGMWGRYLATIFLLFIPGPWLIAHILRFRFKNTVLTLPNGEEMRFSCTATGGGIFVRFLLLMLGFSFLIPLPWVLAGTLRWFAERCEVHKSDGSKRYRLHFAATGAQLIGPLLLGLVCTIFLIPIFWYACWIRKWIYQKFEIIENEQQKIGNLDFVGTGINFFVQSFLAGLTYIFPIFAAWGVVRMQTFSWNHTRIRLDGSQSYAPKFVGRGSDLFILTLVNGFLTGVTFGIWMSRAFARKYQFDTNNLSFQPAAD